MPKKKAGGKGKSGSTVPIVSSFRHYRTGLLIEAKNYGIKGFPIGSNSKRRPKG